MARKVTDGKAWNFAIPSGHAVADGELVRVGGLNGCVIGDVDTTQTDRTRAAEMAHDFVHSIHVPTGLNPSPGDELFWATPGSYQYGPDNLQASAASAGDKPCFFVMESRTSDGDGGYVIRGRVLNGVGGWAS